MSGWKRLAVFLSGAWVILWFLAFLADPLFYGTPFKWDGFAVAVVPLGLGWALVLGVRWVARGFRDQRGGQGLP